MTHLGSPSKATMAGDLGQAETAALLMWAPDLCLQAPTFGGVCGVCWWIHSFTSVQWVSTCENKVGSRRQSSWAHAWFPTWPSLQLILENVIQIDRKTRKNSQNKAFFLLFHKSLFFFFSSLKPYKDYVWSSNGTEQTYPILCEWSKNCPTHPLLSYCMLYKFLLLGSVHI